MSVREFIEKSGLTYSFVFIDKENWQFQVITENSELQRFIENFSDKFLNLRVDHFEADDENMMTIYIDGSFAIDLEGEEV